MINLLRAKIYKMLRHRSFLWLNGLMIFFVSFIISLALIDKYGLLDRIDNITVEVEAEVDFSGFNFLVLMLEMPEVFLIFLYTAILGAFFISQEYMFGTMKNLVSVSYARWKVYLAKFITFVFSALFIYSVLLLASLILGSLAFGIGEWPEEWSLVYLSKVLILTVLFIISIVSFVMIFSIVATNNGLALILSLVFYIMVNTGLNMLSHQYKIAESMIQYSVFARFSTVSEYALSQSNFLESGLIAIVTTILALSIGIVFFQRKDIA